MLESENEFEPLHSSASSRSAEEDVELGLLNLGEYHFEDEDNGLFQYLAATEGIEADAHNTTTTTTTTQSAGPGQHNNVNNNNNNDNTNNNNNNNNNTNNNNNNNDNMFEFNDDPRIRRRIALKSWR